MYDHNVTRLIKFGNSNTDIYNAPDSLNTISAYAFANDNSITTVNLNNVVSIEHYAFYSSKINVITCNNLTMSGYEAFNDTIWLQNQEQIPFVVLGKTLIKYNGESDIVEAEMFSPNVETIGAGAFSFSDLTQITFPVSIDKVGDYAFYGCEKLTSIVLGENISYIGESAFQNCATLTDIEIRSVYPQIIGQNAFDGNGFNSNIYVPYIGQAYYKEYNPFYYYDTRIQSRDIDVCFVTNYDNTIPNTSFKYYSIISEIPTLSREGYIFGGWFDNIDYNGNAIVVGSLWDKTSSTILYAKWIPEVYVIEYDYNGGNSVANPTTFTIEDIVELSEPSRTGYEFLGWYNGDQKVTDIASYHENLSLIAQWSAKEYTIIFDLNANDAVSSDISTQILYDSEFSLPVPERNNYCFEGWFSNSFSKQFTTSEGSGLFIWDVDSDITLYAKWTPFEYEIKIGDYDEIENQWSFNIWWNENGISTSPVTVKYGTQADFYSSVTSYFETSEGLKPGHIFSYFYTSWDNDFGKWYSIPDLGTNGSTILVYPQWEKETYSIFCFDKSTIVTIIQNMTYNAELKIPTPSKLGYDFTKWVVQDDQGRFDGTIFENGSEFNYTRMPDITPTSRENGSIILEAVWTPKTTLISLNSNNAIIGAFNATYDSALSDLYTPSRLGYKFGGWFDQEDGKGDQFDKNTIWKSTASSFALYAKWTIETYTIKYNLNSGDTSGNNQTTYNVNSSFVLNSATRRGYRFNGWRDQNNNIVVSISPGRTGNLELTAQWIGSYINANNFSSSSISVSNCGSDTVLFDLKDKSVSASKNYTIESSISEITFKDTSRNLTNFRITISDRSTPLTIRFWDINITAPNSYNAIEHKSSSNLEIYSYNANNKITSGGVSSNSDIVGAIRAEKASVTISGESGASFEIVGGDGTTYGTNGGFGISAKSIKINIKELIVRGGNGYAGKSGTDGKRGDDGINAPLTGGLKEGAAGGNGTNGANGNPGGNGGDGNYAISAETITIVNSVVKCYGGSGGKGGKGGDGGDGGDGGNGRDAKAFVYSGPGGNGGDGGNGGKGGDGGKGSNAVSGTIVGSISINESGKQGEKGKGGNGGAGGSGGSGGKLLKGTYQPDGADGDDGDDGADGQGR